VHTQCDEASSVDARSTLLEITHELHREVAERFETVLVLHPANAMTIRDGVLVELCRTEDAGGGATARCHARELSAFCDTIGRDWNDGQQYDPLSCWQIPS
jgi:hypothetical protein